MKRTVAIGLLVAALGAGGGASARADCRTQEAEITRALQRWQQRMQQQDHGFCRMAQEAQSFFQKALAFYERCPVNDPNGEMRAYSRKMIAWGRETERKACAR